MAFTVEAEPRALIREHRAQFVALGASLCDGAGKYPCLGNQVHAALYDDWHVGVIGAVDDEERGW